MERKGEAVGNRYLGEIMSWGIWVVGYRSNGVVDSSAREHLNT